MCEVMLFQGETFSGTECTKLSRFVYLKIWNVTLTSTAYMVSYSAFHKTFDKCFPKFVCLPKVHYELGKFIRYVVVNQIVNFETKL